LQISTRTVSHRSLTHVAKQIIKDVILDVNGTPDFLLLAFTSNYKNKQEYQKALERIANESGTKNIIGGTFPVVSTYDDPPTIQGGAAFAIKTNEINFQPPVGYQNIRVKKNRAINDFSSLYNKNNEKSKIAFILSTGPALLPNAMEQLRLLDSYPARKFKKVFNFLGDGLEWLLGRQGLGTGSYIDEILEKMANAEINELIGGATFDLDLEPNFQFHGNKVLSNSLVGTVFSSNKIKFGHSWAFDKSKKTKQYRVTDYLNSGYVQQINSKPANQELLNIMDIPTEIYNEAFETYAYANALYLSGLKEKNGKYHPYMTANHPKLGGVITTLPKSKLKNQAFEAELFTQSGDGIQRSAHECASHAIRFLKQIKFGIFINCANRLLIAGDKIVNENEEIKTTLGENVPFISLYSGCEFSIFNGDPTYTTVSIHGMVAGN